MILFQQYVKFRRARNILQLKEIFLVDKPTLLLAKSLLVTRLSHFCQQY
jgi:hypothetical protein